MSPILATYASWHQLYREWPSYEQVAKELRGLNRLHAVLLLARFSIHFALDRWHADSDESVALQKLLVSHFIDDGLLEKLKERYGSERLDIRRAFHWQQVLTLAKWVLLEGNQEEGARPDTDREAAYALGRCLLMTSDLLTNPQALRELDTPSWRKKVIALQLQVGSGFEINNPPAVKESVVRTDLMFGELLGQVGDALNIRGVFKANTSLDLSAYLDMMFAVLAHYIAKSHRELIDDPRLYLLNLQTFFGNVAAQETQHFWSMELATPDELTAEFRKPTKLKPHHDFIAFRRKPFVKVSEQAAVCISPGFVQEKLESGLFWSIFNYLPNEKDRQHLFNTWGRMFEKYVDFLLRSAIAEDSEVYFSFPRFANSGDEAFDGIIATVDKCFVLEFKGGFLKAEAKYAENQDELVKDLELKFGTGEGAGVEQLARKIAQVFLRKESDRMQIEGLETSGIRLVVPILVVQEPFVSSQFTALWLADCFRFLLRKRELTKDISWLGLIVLDVADVEAMRRYLVSRKITFGDCLMERARLGDRALDFQDFFRNYLNQRKVEAIPDTYFDERFHDVVNRVSIRFFGHELHKKGERT